MLGTPTLDHLVVAARDLGEGVGWIESRLGVAVSPGGKHALFGTHNALLSLGDGTYLEIIAPDPTAPSPTRPRWFGLDAPETRARLDRGPQLLHWVVRVPDLPTGPIEPHGAVLGMRRGEFDWSLTVPVDGSLPMYGALPGLIAWRGRHPSEHLDDRGVRLEGLTLTTPAPDELTRYLTAIDATDLAVVRRGAPSLHATLRTPDGTVVLGGSQVWPA